MKHRSNKRALCLLLTVLLLACAPLSPLAAARAEAERAPFALLVYMCGSDLETEDASATEDLFEMAACGLEDSENLAVLVQTGGAREWNIEGVEGDSTWRWLVGDDALYPIEEVGTADMGDAKTLSDFILWGVEAMPAERYGLLLWDHGNGAQGGVCLDERTGNELDMTDLHNALSNTQGKLPGGKFEFIAFDACLMASYEVARHIAPFSDVMIASEELAPGEGLPYDRWLPALEREPTISAAALGRAVADEYVQSVFEMYAGEEIATLSVVDLTKIAALGDALDGFAASLSDAMQSGDFPKISALRHGIANMGRAEGDDDCGLIDLRAFVNAYARWDEAAAANVLAALDDALLYSRHTPNLTDGDICGLNLLLPADGRRSGVPEGYDTRDLYPAFAAFARGYLSAASGDSYAFQSASVSAVSGEQAQAGWSGELDLWGLLPDAGTGATTGTAGMWSGLQPTAHADDDAGSPFGALTDDDHAYVLALSEDDWNHLAQVQANLMMDVSEDGVEMYIELGYVDDVYLDTESGLIYGLFDGTWPRLEGQMVCAIDQYSTENYIRAVVPATVNGVSQYLIVVYTEEHPQGRVVGYSAGYNDSGMPLRGYQTLAPGDVVVPEYELIWWDENDEQQSETFWGDPIAVGEGALDFGYEDVAPDAEYVYGFCLTNVFGEETFSDFVTLSY